MSKSRKIKRIQRLRTLLRGRKATGRKTFSYTIALTIKQIQWLTERYKNSSELFRRLLDSHIKSMDKVEPDVVKLGYKLKHLVTEKEAREREKHTHWSDKEQIERQFYKMQKKEKFWLKFIETPEDQVEIIFPEKDDLDFTIWVKVIGDNGEKLTWFQEHARYSYVTKDRQQILDVIKAEIKSSYNKRFKEEMKQVRKDKAIFDAVQSAFAENIRLLEKDIDKVVEKINIINKQTNQQS